MRRIKFKNPIKARARRTDRAGVHAEVPAANVYTASSSCTQKGAVKRYSVPDGIVSIREVRANLKACIDSGKAVRIGGWHHLRAVLVPVEPERTWDTEKRLQCVERAKKLFAQAMRKGVDN